MIFFFTTAAFCQNKDTTYKYWMPIGIETEPTYFTFHTGYCFSINDNFYKAGYFIKGDLGPDGFLTAMPGKYAFRSLSALIGKRAQAKWFAAYAFGGVAYVDGLKGISNGATEKIHTFGLQAEAYLLFRIANEVGIGLSGIANANPTKCFVGSAITFTIGNGK